MHEPHKQWEKLWCSSLTHRACLHYGLSWHDRFAFCRCRRKFKALFSFLARDALCFCCLCMPFLNGCTYPCTHTDSHTTTYTNTHTWTHKHTERKAEKTKKKINLKKKNAIRANPSRFCFPKPICSCQYRCDGWVFIIMPQWQIERFPCCCLYFCAVWWRLPWI